MTAIHEDSDGSFVAPRLTLFADGASLRVGRVLDDLGIVSGPTLLVVDRVVEQLGIRASIAEKLVDSCFEASTFVVPPGEPDTLCVDQAIAVARARSAQTIVAVGGGSTIDVAKLVALGITNPIGVAEMVGGRTRWLRAAAPLIAIPTTAGTGAESTQVAVVTVANHKRVVVHPSMVPHAAILDPLLLRTLPPSVTAATGIDALAHAIESYLSTNQTFMSASCSERAVELLTRFLPRAVADGEDLIPRRATMHGAYLAGLALNAGVIVGHSIAYTIANRTSLPHGVTCGMALPYCVAYSRVESRTRLAALSTHIHGLASPQIPDFCEWIRDFGQSFAIPSSLASVGVREVDLAAMVDECMTMYPRTNSPRPLERAPLTAIYAALHAGALDEYAELDEGGSHG